MPFFFVAFNTGYHSTFFDKLQFSTTQFVEVYAYVAALKIPSVIAMKAALEMPRGLVLFNEVGRLQYDTMGSKHPKMGFPQIILHNKFGPSDGDDGEPNTVIKACLPTIGAWERVGIPNFFREPDVPS